MKWSAYARLSRLNKPSGTLLLWIPTAIALWVANNGKPSLKWVFLFFLGTLFMRAAGCILNDIADRQIDLHVQRTQGRPLTSGEVSLQEAFVLLGSYLFLSLFIVLQLPRVCFLWAIPSLLITIFYPFCKRFLAAPQLVLSIAFSMSIPMVFAASNNTDLLSISFLFVINFFWILAYDTQYAMADREDDLRIGVRSTAILFGNYDLFAIGLCQLISHLLWVPLAIHIQLPAYFFWGWGLAGALLFYQQRLIQNREPANCLNAFSWNSVYGLILWVTVAA